MIGTEHTGLSANYMRNSSCHSSSSALDIIRVLGWDFNSLIQWVGASILASRSGKKQWITSAKNQRNTWQYQKLRRHRRSCRWCVTQMDASLVCEFEYWFRIIVNSISTIRVINAMPIAQPPMLLEEEASEWLGQGLRYPPLCSRDVFPSLVHLYFWFTTYNFQVNSGHLIVHSHAIFQWSRHNMVRSSGYLMATSFPMALAANDKCMDHHHHSSNLLFLN